MRAQANTQTHKNIQKLTKPHVHTHSQTHTSSPPSPDTRNTHTHTPRRPPTSKHAHPHTHTPAPTHKHTQHKKQSSHSTSTVECNRFNASILLPLNAAGKCLNSLLFSSPSLSLLHSFSPSLLCSVPFFFSHFNAVCSQKHNGFHRESSKSCGQTPQETVLAAVTQ